MVVVGSAVGLSQPSVIWLSREDDENVVSTVPITAIRTCQQNGSAAQPWPCHNTHAARTWPGWVTRQWSASCVVSAERDRSLPHPHCQCLAACGGDSRREA